MNQQLQQSSSTPYRLKAFPLLACRWLAMLLMLLTVQPLTAQEIWNGGNMTWTNPDSDSWGGGNTFNNGESVQFNGAGLGTINISGTVQPSSMSINSVGDYTFTGGALSGGMSITKSGSGTATLNNDFKYTGSTTVNGGRLNLYGAAPGLGYHFVTGGDLNVNNGSTLGIGATRRFIFFTNENWNLDSNGGNTLDSIGRLFLNGVNTITTTGGTENFFTGSGGVSSQNGTLRLNIADGSDPSDMTLSAVFSGFTGGMEKNGAGTLTLTGANTYPGNTTVNEGTMVTANASGSATGSGNVILNGGTLRMNTGSNISIAGGNEFAVSGGDLNQIDGSTWTMDLFRVNAASVANSIQISDMPDSLDGDSDFMFSPGQGGMSGVEFTTADPFAQAGGLGTWTSEWGLGIDPAGSMADTDFAASYTLLSSSGGFDLTTLLAAEPLVSYSASTDDFWTYENASDGDLIKIQSGNSLATYRLNVSSTEVSLTFKNIFAIPEPSTLMLIGMGIPALLLRRRIKR